MPSLILTVAAVGGFVAAIMVALATGRRMGRIAFAASDATARPAGLSAVEAVAFGLLGLLLAFTFSGAAARLDVRRTQTIKEGEVSVGARTRGRVVKNKIAPPFRDAEFDIMFDRGISYEGDLLDLAATINVVEKSGAWYNYKTTRLGQGRENAKQFLFENKDLAEEIRTAVLNSKGMLNAKKAMEIPEYHGQRESARESQREGYTRDLVKSAAPHSGRVAYSPAALESSPSPKSPSR